MYRYSVIWEISAVEEFWLKLRTFAKLVHQGIVSCILISEMPMHRRASKPKVRILFLGCWYAV